MDSARTKLVVANVSLGVGIAALGVGALLWAVQDSSSSKGASASGLRFGDFAFDVRPARGSGAEVVTTFTAP